MSRFFTKTALLALLCVLGAFSVSALAGVTPKFSNGTASHWYLIKFNQGGVYLTGHGNGQTATVETYQATDEQLWKLVGDENQFFLVDKKNRYAAVKNGKWDDKSNNCPLQVVTKKPAEGFRLLASGTGYEIESLLFPQKYLNTWGGTGAGTSIGVWKDKGDANNIVVFESNNGGPFSLSGVKNYAPSEKLTLWYTSPAKDNHAGDAWMEYSLPIGNGQLGASIFGGVRNDEILFNEKTLWTGTSKSVGTTGWGGNNNEYGSYQVFGSIDIADENGLSAVTDYLRDLNLANATASMSYKHGGVDYKREYIVSYPERVVATHLTATQPGSISVTVSLNPKMSMGAGKVAYTTTNTTGDAHFNGKLDVVSFDARMRVVADGGKVLSNGSGIQVSGANEVTIYLAAGTDFDNSNASFVSGTNQLASVMEGRVNSAAQKGWTSVYADHVQDYQNYFGRVRLDLNGSANTMDTKSLVDSYRGGTAANDLMLEQLYFNYGRYLEIASSRGVALPSNLQGIWANNNKSAWNADIHANINVQMNYWPAEATNLSDMHLPFLNYIMAMYDSEPWMRYAHESGEKRGWTCYTENNIFGGVGVWAHNYVIVNAWYCTHLWQHYRYTLDAKFLEDAFPAMLSATQFWLDRLKLRDGVYVCPDETSPEHGPKAEDGVAHAQQLVWELFDNTLKAVKVLGEQKCGISSNDLNDLREKFAKLDKGLATEKGPNGQQLLREWKYSKYTAGQNGHRHLSHLMCLYPLNQVNSDSEFFQPAINSLLHRGDPSTGWSMGWKINLWARALDGNHAHKILKMALKHSTSYGTDESKGGIYYNLFDSHSPFQIDGNFGACAGITEMLFQSHSEVLDCLPALPDTWQNGSVTGLKGVGNFTVDVEWQNGKATKLTIVNHKGQPCRVRCKRSHRKMDLVLVTVDGVNTLPVAQANDVYEIPSAAGQTIVIDFTQDAGVTPDPEPDPDPQPVYNGECGPTLTWVLNPTDGVLTIEGTGAMYDFTTENQPTWTGVAAEVTSVVLPEGLTRIGDRAFADCVNVPQMVFTNNKVVFGVGAFAPETSVELNIQDKNYVQMPFELNSNDYDKVVYDRELPIECWATIVLPFVPNLNGLYRYYFYELKEVSTGVVVFGYTESLKPNTPYLYKRVYGSQQSPMVSDGMVKIDPDASMETRVNALGVNWTMIGTYQPMTFSDVIDLQTLYVMSNGKLMNSTNSVVVKSFRAYFRGPKYSRDVRVVIREKDGTETDITDELVDQMEEDGAVYDLQGRKVDRTIPGNIYIRNHTKFMAE